MAVTETEHVSWGSRLGNSIKNVIGGIALFILAFPLLFWNEGRTLHRHQALEEGASTVISLPDNKKADAANEGKLVHMSGRGTTAETLTDSAYGVTVKKAYRLVRGVEMFQWKENVEETRTKNAGGSEDITRTYTYKKVWSSTPIDSSSFREAGHENPAWTLEKAEFQAKNVDFGAFKLTESQIRNAGTLQPVPMPKRETPLPAGLDPQYVVRTGTGFYQSRLPLPLAPVTTTEEAPAATNTPAAPARVSVRRTEPAQAQIGDMRITFSYAPECDLSFVGRQAGNQLVPYKTKAGKGETILLQENGIKDAQSMFQTAEEANTMMGYILRFVGFMMMFIGLKTFFKPLEVLADVLPIMGNIVGAGASMIAFLIALVCSILTIGIAWVFYRPVAGIITLLVAAALAWMTMKRLKNASVRRKAEQAAAQPAE